MSSRFQAELKNNLGLYVITTQSQERSHVDVAKAAIEGGASIIQYRDKHSTNRKQYEIAKEIRKLTKEAGVKFIINDRIDLVLAVGADGVHLGDDDFPYTVTRELLGPNYIVGVSTTNLDEALYATKLEADYIGVGPVYDTQSKDCGVPSLGIEELTEIRKATGIPMVAIGGICLDNVHDVLSARPDGIAVIAAVAAADNMIEAARKLATLVEDARAAI